MDAEQAWLADLEDEEPPEDEPEYWEDDEFTPEELTAWADAMAAAERRPAPAPDDSLAQPEGGVPDLVGAVLEAGGDPALMTDADLLGSLAGWHAVAARAVARELRATEELLRRRRPRVRDRRADRAESAREDLDPVGDGPERVMAAVVPSRAAASELALALTATEYSAQAQVELTADLSRRLPVAFGELDAGRADLARVRVLAEGTQFLSGEDAARVDAVLSARLGQWTTGDLKERVRRAVMAIDPAAADRRAAHAAHAARKARFGLYANPDHTATAAVERMPAQLGAAVKARVNAIARAAKAAGMPGPLPLLEAKVATGLLLDTLPDIPPPHDGGPAGGDTGGGGPSGGPADPGPAGPWDDGWPAGWFPAQAGTDADKVTDTGTRTDSPGADFTGDDSPSPAGDPATGDDPDVEDSGGAGPVNFTPPDPADRQAEGTGPLDGEVRPAGEMSWPPLRRWLNTRDRICRNPICRRRAVGCDQDHTLAYDRGGKTCTCNLGGLCRVHHQLKQLPGWQLTRDAQGYFTWTTPAGLTYRKEPYRYAI